jgi:hypothetical protein
MIGKIKTNIIVLLFKKINTEINEINITSINLFFNFKIYEIK